MSGNELYGRPPRPTAETGIRNRCGSLPALRRRCEDNRVYRRPGGDQADPVARGSKADV